MVKNNFIANVEILMESGIDKVWDAFINPATIKKYMFGTTVISDWKVGSTIVWEGEWKGKPYKDKGTILQIKPENILQYNHFSPMTGLSDTPENYHIVTITFKKKDDETLVSLSQDNNVTEQAKEYSEKNWTMMLAGVKKLLETK